MGFVGSGAREEIARFAAVADREVARADDRLGPGALRRRLLRHRIPIRLKNTVKPASTAMTDLTPVEPPVAEIT